MIKPVKRFFKRNKWLAFILLIITAGLLLDLTGKDRYAHFVLGTGTLLTLIPLCKSMVDTLRSGGYGIHILAAVAIVTSVILREYWAGIILALMLTGGKALEDSVERKVKSAFSDLLEGKPRYARVIKGTQANEVPPSDVRVGDRLIVLPGETVPMDCEILEGDTSIDESWLTGETLLINKRPGDQLLSGSVNNEGKIMVRALRSAADSQYEQIIKLVRAASASRSPFTRLADRYTVPFTIFAFLLAGGTWLVSGQAERFLEVVVVATPIPLILGAPIALISGISRAAKHGIFIKTGSAMERLAEVRTIAFDKTGTLTKGVTEVDQVLTYSGFKINDVLDNAATIEQSSNHVLAKAIVTHALKRKIKLGKAKQIKEIAGHGVAGRLKGKSVYVGRMNYIINEGVELPPNFKASAIKQTAAFVAIDGKLAGIITFKDDLRPETEVMLARLKRSGIKHSLLVTGNSETAAKAVARQLGIEDVRADCLPADKLLAIENAPHKPVAFVGDGVSDAPVLTASDVGIAFGARGSIVASEAADVIIMLDDASKVARSIEIAKRTFKIARQSILVGIFLSLALMVIFSTGRFRAVHGVFLQEVIAIIVILISLRAHGRVRKDALPA